MNDVRLDVGPGTQLAAQATHDYDADGTLATNAEELAGLVGTKVTLLVTEGTGATPADTVYSINGLDYRLADGSFA